MTQPFAAMSRHWATRLSMPNLPIIVLEHPLAQFPTAEIELRGERSVDEAVAGLVEAKT